MKIEEAIIKEFSEATGESYEETKKSIKSLLRKGIIKPTGIRDLPFVIDYEVVGRISQRIRHDRHQ